MPENSAERDFWYTQARLAAVRFNLAWWLAYFLPYLFILSVVLASALLLLRAHTADTGMAWYSAAAALFGGALLMYVLTRRRLIGPDEAIVQIEWSMGLNSELSAARAGVVPWPRRREVHSGWRWEWRRVLAPVCASVLVVGGAYVVPVNRAPAARAAAAAAELPMAVTEVEAWVEKLEKDGVLNQESIEKLKQELAELKSKDPEEWFDHSNLEAAESLKEKTAQELKALLGNLEKVQGLLAAEEIQNLPEAERQKIEEGLKQSFKDLQSGSLAPSEQLSRQLGELAQQGYEGMPPGKTVPLTKELKEKLRALQQNPGTKSQGSGSQGSEGEGAQQPQSGQSSSQGGCPGGSSAPMCMEGEKQPGNGRDGDGENGSSGGGINRGPGHAPLNLAEKSPQLTSNRTEQVSSGQESNLEPGELLGLSQRAPEADEVAAPAAAAGSIAGPGEGGAVAWQNSFTPEEQEVLKRYFTKEFIDFPKGKSMNSLVGRARTARAGTEQSEVPGGGDA